MTHSSNEDMIRAFVVWRQTEENIRVIETEILEKQALLLKAEIHETDARLVVEKLMTENGILQDTLPGEGCDYKIELAQLPDKISVADDKAVPDEFIEEHTERKVKKRELLAHLKSLRDAKNDLPNYATIEKGGRKLRWKAIKK